MGKTMKGVPKTMQDNDQRRNFLKGAAISAAAVGSAALVGKSAAAEIESAPATKDKPGYQESAHVKEYYRLARF